MRHRLAFALVVITLASVAAFLARHWLPPLASAEGVYFDRQFHFSLIVIAIAFVAAQVALAITVVRSSSRNSAKIDQRHESKAELAWITVVVLILAALATTGATALAHSRDYAEQKTIHIEATGMQFQWYFRYPGADNIFGETKPTLIDASVGNPLGIDPSDAYGADDIVSTSAMVPIGHTVDISLRSQDVIHSFYMPAMRIKQDAVPGLNPHIRFTPTALGSFEVACAELCGLGHYRMFTRVNVVSEAEYAHWIAAHHRTPAHAARGGAQ